MKGNTRYLSLLISSMYSRSLVESGCKDTTIFNTGKIFFQKKFIRSTNCLYVTNKTFKLFFPASLWKHPQTDSRKPNQSRFRPHEPFSLPKKLRNIEISFCISACYSTFNNIAKMFESSAICLYVTWLQTLCPTLPFHFRRPCPSPCRDPSTTSRQKEYRSFIRPCTYTYIIL